jgi:peptide deformylase
MRAEKVWARAADLDGKTIKFQGVEELLAQALEHEADHLDGVLFIDHLKTKDDLFEVTEGEEEDDGAPRAQEPESAQAEG